VTLWVDAWTFRELLADPAMAESMSAVAGCPLIVVEVNSAAAGSLLADADIDAVPAVILIVVGDFRYLPRAATGAADVVLTEAAEDVAGIPFIRPPGGVASGVAAIGAAMAANPVAGATLALLLRGSARLSVPAALVAESAAYSALQDGAEFRRWRSDHPARPPEPGTERVRVDFCDGEVRITLARPGRRNALDWRMRDALVSALAQGAASPDRPVVLRGDGPDFCAGGDLDEFGSRPDPAQAHLIRLTRSPARLMHRVGARTTAFLHGSCLGAGIELPAFAARVQAAEGTSLGLPELSLGLIPGAGGTVSLPRRIGRWRTAYLALTGRPIDEERALQWGLIDAIGPEPAST
jgi:enoyl-CoA hydratase/carnithine racemase